MLLFLTYAFIRTFPIRLPWLSILLLDYRYLLLNSSSIGQRKWGISLFPVVLQYLRIHNHLLLITLVYLRLSNLRGSLYLWQLYIAFAAIHSLMRSCDVQRFGRILIAFIFFISCCNWRLTTIILGFLLLNPLALRIIVSVVLEIGSPRHSFILAHNKASVKRIIIVLLR